MTFDSTAGTPPDPRPKKLKDLLPDRQRSTSVSARPIAPPIVEPPPIRPSAPPEIRATSAKREKIEATYKQLSQAAVDLNTASDALSKPIQVWEAALKKLNLGVPAWAELSSGDDPITADWWNRAVGYTRLKDRWGIALRKSEGNHGRPEHDSEELWPFNEAPRWMRIEAVGKLPDLLDALLKQAADTTQKLRVKVEQANELAEAISGIAEEMTSLSERK